MKPLLLIAGLALFLALAGWTWSERPQSPNLYEPTWTPSFRLYGQPHAVWLDRYERVGANVPVLMRVLKEAARERQIPELVVYAIPLRDLGQASEGGFKTMADYLADNQINAGWIAKFVKATGIHPVIYLEPDGLPLAVQYRRERNHDEESERIYRERIQVFNTLIDRYRQVGAQVYLEAGHSGWFNYGEEDLQRIADALNAAGIERADGLAANISNRQPVADESAYLRRLLPMLHNRHLDVRVDTSRNGGPTHARQYYLAPGGKLWDNETAAGRLVGSWKRDVQGTVRIYPFFGPPKSLERLTGKEKYTYHPGRRLLIAPAWLDAVGDVQPGPKPRQEPRVETEVIRSFRYIKPPDDGDGAINYPPGASKEAINAETAKRQPEETPPHIQWL